MLEHCTRPEHFLVDRRNKRRYGIHLDLRWRLVRRRNVVDAGTGQTIDFSSRGILFRAGRQLTVGYSIELSIQWPALLDKIAPMQLVVSGRIVRVSGSEAAIEMRQHEFRTAGAPAYVAGGTAAGRTPGALVRSAGMGRFEL